MWKNVTKYKIVNVSKTRKKLFNPTRRRQSSLHKGKHARPSSTDNANKRSPERPLFRQTSWRDENSFKGKSDSFQAKIKPPRTPRNVVTPLHYEEYAGSSGWSGKRIRLLADITRLGTLTWPILCCIIAVNTLQFVRLADFTRRTIRKNGIH